MRRSLDPSGSGLFDEQFRICRQDTGEVRWVHNRCQTLFVDTREGRIPVRNSGLVIDITDRKRAEEALIAAHNTFRHLVEQSPFGIYTVDADFRVVHVSAGAQKVFQNVRPLIGRNLEEVLRTIWSEPFATEAVARFRHTLATGKPYHAPSSVERRRDVEATEAYDWKIDRIMLPDGRPGVVCHFYDLSERQRHEERERLLMREVNHRSKNMLALVQAIARQTVAGSPQEFVERFKQRIQALSANQDVLVRSGWRNVPLEELMRAQLDHFSDLVGHRITLSGPPLEITAAAAQALGLAVHELATNAAKYGALANDTGTVTVSWALDAGTDEPRWVMSWVEAGGPAVTEPHRRGFGSTVIGIFAETSLGGVARTDFAARGLSWSLSCPARKVVEGFEPCRRKQTRKADPPAAPSGRRRVLIVEDEPLIAMEIAATLNDAAFQVIGPVSSVDAALRMIGQGNCDCAVLDVNLGDESAEPVAVDLAERGLPFVTVTGYTPDQVPAAFNAAPLVSKPIRTEQLVALLRQSISAAPPV